MHPSNILVALAAPFLSLTQAAALHPKSHITVHLYGDYGQQYVEKVWPDGDEHWFSKSISFSRYSAPFSPMSPVSIHRIHRADTFTQQTRARMSGRSTLRSSSSSTTRRSMTVASVVCQQSPSTPGTRSRSSSSSCLTSMASMSTVCSWRSLSPLRSFVVIFPKLRSLR